MRMIKDQDLKDMISEHELWNDTEGCEGKRLELSKVDFSWLKLSLAGLENAILTDCDFSNSDLDSISFKNSILTRSTFKNASLSCVSLNGKYIDMEGCDFTDTILEETTVNIFEFKKAKTKDTCIKYALAE